MTCALQATPCAAGRVSARSSARPLSTCGPGCIVLPLARRVFRAPGARSGQGRRRTACGPTCGSPRSNCCPALGTPEKILCVGVNYKNRPQDYDIATTPKYPSMFYRAPNSLVGSGQNLVRPKISEQLDYEGEIAIVIGRDCKHVAKGPRARRRRRHYAVPMREPSAIGPATASSTSPRARISTPAAASARGSRPTSISPSRCTLSCARTAR